MYKEGCDFIDKIEILKCNIWKKLNKVDFASQ